MNISIRKSFTLLSLLALVAAPIVVSAITYNPPITINNPTPIADDLFGHSISVDGNKFVVGIPGAKFGFPGAHLYDTTTGALLHAFNKPTPTAAGYGHSVSMSGDKVLISAPFYSSETINNAGAAYLYDATTGAILQTFNNPTPSPEGSVFVTFSDRFGLSVSISGDKVLIGAPMDDAGATDAGSAYLYDATTGALLQTFNSPAPAISVFFGWSVSISGDKVLVGTLSNDTTYLYDATTGALLQIFNNPTPAGGDQFGDAVSISGNNVLIGAPNYKFGTINNVGSAYLYDATTGALLQTFNNPTPEANDRFGHSVSISGNKVLIGADSDYTGFSLYSSVGSAYLFDATTGALLQTFNNPTPGAIDRFGGSVSISGDKALVGASYDDTGATDAGSVYLYLPLPDTDGDGIFDSVDNCPADANADQADTDGDGEGDICDFTPNGDTDGDGVDNLADNCSGIANPDQADTDNDGTGNVCDPTPNGDTDNDGIDNLTDNCPADANADQIDTDGDGVGDVCDPTPPEEVEALIDLVEVFNFQQGIANTLDAKLDAALNALNDVNVNNNQAAINSLQAFINSVEAQRGNKITNEQADTLIAEAQAIIGSLSL